MSLFARAIAPVAPILLLFSTAGYAQGPKPTTVPGSKPAEIKLDMARAIETAVANSKALRSAAQAVLRARGAVNESRSAFLPTLGAELSLTHLDQGVVAQLGEDPAASITIVRQDQKSATLTAAVPVDLMGLIRAATTIAEYQYLIARLDYNRQRNQLIQDVSSAYLDVLRAEAFVAVAERSSKNAEDRAKIADSHLRAGTGTKYDVLRAQTEIANAQQNVIAAGNRVELASALLNRLLELDQSTPLRLEAPPAAEPASEPVLEPLLTEAYSRRPELLQAETGLRAAQKGYYLASRSQLPTFALAWNLQYTPDTGAFGKKSSWAAVARASLPIFDGGAGAARRQQAKAGISEAELNRQQALDGVALDVRQSFLSLSEAAERLKVAEAAMTQAEEAYRLAQVRYQAGVTMTAGGSPLLEIGDAQTALTQAQTNRINALYDVAVARARLSRAVGRFAYPASGATGPDTTSID